MYDTMESAPVPAPSAGLEMPFARHGLSERQAASILLDRFAFGARPGEIENIMALGVSRWMTQQLDGSMPDPPLHDRLAMFEALAMNDKELMHRYPTSAQVSAHARRYYNILPGRDEVILDFSVVAAARDKFAAEQGFLDPEKELTPQLRGQKIVRAVHARNQLREVLTDFWGNHFFTSPLDFRARQWILPFERDALRPNALGHFRHLLGAVAKHPALNRYHAGAATPSALASSDTALATSLARLHRDNPARDAALETGAAKEIEALEYEEDLILKRKFWPATGPNPEFARALVAMHTMGPQGAYTDRDLAEIARAFTGWHVMSSGPTNQWFAHGLDHAVKIGFVKEGSFFFRADWHDATEKTVLGQRVPAGGGVADGESVLDLLAQHQDTARYISRKLAIRFVSEEPSTSLVKRMATTFQMSKGDIADVIRTMVQAPEFWEAAKRRAKIKTPFEYAASALRATGADVRRADTVSEWIGQMGQPLYGYMLPTGYPDRASYWLDTAAVLKRIAFAEHLTRNQIPGAIVDVSAIGGSAIGGEAAGLVRQLLPGRDIRRIETALSNYRQTTDEGDKARVISLVLASPDFQQR